MATPDRIFIADDPQNTTWHEETLGASDIEYIKVSLAEKIGIDRAVEKLKTLAGINDCVADKMEIGDLEIKQAIGKDESSFIKLYRYWAQCLLIAAWLLKNDEEIDR